LTIAIFIIYLFGQKLLISPYSRLEKSQSQLAKQTQKLAEKQQEARLLADVVRHARDAIVITNNEGMIEWLNPAFVSMTGFTMQDVKGHRPGDVLVDKGSDPNMATKLHHAIENKMPTRVEVMNFDKDNNEYWVDIDLSPTFSDKGNVDHFILVQRDITDYKKLQRNLEHAVEDADAANVAKSRFLATMSHEIRTPMNGVLGMIQVMLSEEKNKEKRANLALILESGNHLISILNDILDLTKVEQNKIEFESAPFSIEQIITPLDSTYAPICREKGITLTINNKLPADGYFLGDKKRVRKILYNLINNAIKFTHKGEISLSIFPCLNNGNNVTPDFR
jgi:PAS domain S-box-containing protein